ncbi:sensor histidine kinase, partial [Streptomyces lunaelactis]|nr:sensor histidine kinase [Streptomyces lunaelactis]
VLPYGVVEAAPFVAAEDDFRQQSPKAATVNGLPPMDWTVSARELAGGKERSRAGGIAMGCGIGVALVLVLVVAGGFALAFLVGSMSQGMIDPGEYESVKIGSGEDVVRDRLPNGDTITLMGLDGKGPKEPEGSECLVLMSSDVGDSFETEPVFRFCFKGGKLIEKKSYEVSR